MRKRLLLIQEEEATAPTHQVRHRPDYAFVDADNILRSFQKVLEDAGVQEKEFLKFDFSRLFFISDHDRRYVYSAIEHEVDTPDWLQSLEARDGVINKYGVLTKKGKNRKQEGVDVKLAIDAVRLAYSGVIKSCSLYGADGDFVPLVESLSDAGVIVTVYSFSNPSIGRVARKLRAASDRYVRMNRKWIYKTLSLENQTVKSLAGFDRSRLTDDEAVDVEIHGEHFPLIYGEGSYRLQTNSSRLDHVFSSQSKDDLVLWAKLNTHLEVEE